MADSLSEAPIAIETSDYGEGFDKIQKMIESAKTIVLVRHISPDSDAIGSVTALAAALRTRYGENKKIIVASEGSSVSADGGLVIYLDLGEIGRVAGAVSGDYSTARFDHHPSMMKTDAEVVDQSAGSTCELITLFLKAEGYPISKSMSTVLMKGIAADNGRFQYNMSKSSLVASGILSDSGLDSGKLFGRMESQSPLDAKTRSYILGNYKKTKHGVAYIYMDDSVASDHGISMDSAASMAYELSTIRGCPIGVMILGRRHRINAKIRSRGIDVRGVAKKYGGGGHENACGASMERVSEVNGLLSDLDGLAADKSENPSETNNYMKASMKEGQDMDDKETAYDLLEAELPDDPEKREYGVPEEKKFPLCDKEHVVSAIRFFNYVDDSHEKELAGAIVSKMKGYGISADSVGEKNRLRKYLPKESVNESVAVATLAVAGGLAAAGLGLPVIALIQSILEKRKSRASVTWAHIPGEMTSKYPEISNMSIYDISRFIKQNGSDSDKKSCADILKGIKGMFGRFKLYYGPLKGSFDGKKYNTSGNGYSASKNDFVPGSHISNASYYGIEPKDGDRLAAYAVRLIKLYASVKKSPSGKAAYMKMATESLECAIAASSGVSLDEAYYAIREAKDVDDPTKVNKGDVAKAAGAGGAAAVGTGAYAMHAANPGMLTRLGASYGDLFKDGVGGLMKGSTWKQWAATHAAEYGALGSKIGPTLAGAAPWLGAGAALVGVPLAAYGIAKAIRKHRRKKQLMRAGSLAGQTNNPGLLKAKMDESLDWSDESCAVIGSMIRSASPDRIKSLIESGDINQDEASLLSEAIELNGIIDEEGLA